MLGWIAGAVVVGIAIIAVLAVYYHVYKHYHYVCPKCTASFTPTFLRSVFALNGGDTRMMRCPSCNCIQSVQVVKNK